jgi:hypothetical protein
VRTLRLAGATAIVAGLLLASAAPAARAACAARPPGNPYEEAPLVFVGKVASTEHSGYESHVVIEQVWRGHVPKRIVTVVTGPLRSGVGQAEPPGSARENASAARPRSSC